MKPHLLTLLAATATLGATVQAAEPTRAQIEFFENKIRPIFANQCGKCHSRQAEKVKGGLLLDSREGLLKGGKPGRRLCPATPRKVC